LSLSYEGVSCGTMLQESRRMARNDQAFGYHGWAGNGYDYPGVEAGCILQMI